MGCNSDEHIYESGCVIKDKILVLFCKKCGKILKKDIATGLTEY